jgi:NAD(P)-dependent dehydrogenase (short-subunit alcohol dehydrogenase family)
VIQADVSEADQVEKLFAQTLKELGGVDVVVQMIGVKYFSIRGQLFFPLA